ncbi:MAG: hypothetical protein IEMM0002_1587 [bacterium]|nr:MAG: hypothetical protein IEMM0002_1587 [bacterium]
MVETVDLLFYSRPDCHLCDEMKEVVENVLAGVERVPITLKLIDVSADPELEREYGMDVPLLFYGDECIAKHRIAGEELLKRIAKLTRFIHE